MLGRGDLTVWRSWWGVNMDNDNNERWKENCAAAVSHRIGHFEMEILATDRRWPWGNHKIITNHDLLLWAHTLAHASETQSHFGAIWIFREHLQQQLKNPMVNQLKTKYLLFLHPFFAFQRRSLINIHILYMCEENTFMQETNTSTARYSTVCELLKWQPIDRPNTDQR